MHPRAAPEIVDFAARDGFKLNFHHYPAKGNAGDENRLPRPRRRSSLRYFSSAGRRNHRGCTARCRLRCVAAELARQHRLAAERMDTRRRRRPRSSRGGAHGARPYRAKSVKAVIHRQDSISFMMSLVAGLLPDVRLLSATRWRCIRWGRPVTAEIAVHDQHCRGSRHLATRNGASRRLRGWPTVFDRLVRATHHECNNAVCKHSSSPSAPAFRRFGCMRTWTRQRTSGSKANSPTCR